MSTLSAPVAEEVRTAERARDALERSVREVAGQLNVAHARLVELTAEAIDTGGWQGIGLRSPAHWLAWQTGLSPSRAAEIVQIATRRRELPVTIAAFDAGALAVDQVAAVVKHAPAWADRQVCDLATAATVTQLRHALGRYAFDDAIPTGEPDHAPDMQPRDQDRCAFHTDERARFHLAANGDTAGGAIIDAALHEARDALFTAGHPDVTWWDALVEIANRSLDSVDASRRDRFKVYLHVDITDTDTTITRFTNGTAVPDAIRDYLLCDATVQPVWVRDHIPIGIGRTSRVIPERTRRLVMHRDGGRCRVPGCGSCRVEIHHIIHWDPDRGPTETWNLICVCPHHHRLHHKRELHITGDADHPETLVFTDARGSPIHPAGTPIPPTGPLPSPTLPYRHPFGERMHTKWLYFTPPSAN
jgi:hypothetical protein